MSARVQENTRNVLLEGSHIWKDGYSTTGMHARQLNCHSTSMTTPGLLLTRIETVNALAGANIELQETVLPSLQLLLLADHSAVSAAQAPAKVFKLMLMLIKHDLLLCRCAGGCRNELLRVALQREKTPDLVHAAMPCMHSMFANLTVIVMHQLNILGLTSSHASKPTSPNYPPSSAHARPLDPRLAEHVVSHAINAHVGALPSHALKDTLSTHTPAVSCAGSFTFDGVAML
jgi:hypothetical protein